MTYLLIPLILITLAKLYLVIKWREEEYEEEHCFGNWVNM